MAGVLNRIVKDQLLELINLFRKGEVDEEAIAPIIEPKFGDRVLTSESIVDGGGMGTVVSETKDGLIKVQLDRDPSAEMIFPRSSVMKQTNEPEVNMFIEDIEKQRNPMMWRGD